MMPAEDYGRKLILEKIWDFDCPQEYQHFDPSSQNGAFVAAYDMYYHYEGQRRRRKFMALVRYVPDAPEQEGCVSSPKAFRDIQQSIWNNTIAVYSRGFKTPSAFYRYSLTMPSRKDVEK